MLTDEVVAFFRGELQAFSHSVPQLRSTFSWMVDNVDLADVEREAGQFRDLLAGPLYFRFVDYLREMAGAGELARGPERVPVGEQRAIQARAVALLRALREV